MISSWDDERKALEICLYFRDDSTIPDKTGGKPLYFHRCGPPFLSNDMQQQWVIPETTEEDNHLVDSEMQRDDNDIILKINTDKVFRKSLKTLKPEKYLNDKIISVFLESLRKRDE